MGHFLYPDEYYSSTYAINFEKYYRKGYRAVLFDIDNTLVMHDAPANERSTRFLRGLMDIGFKVCFVSNNDEKRVADFNAAVGANYIYKAGKPKARGYREAMELLGTTADTTLFVGDQLFTDIWGANRAGIHSILVKIISKKEKPHIILKRVLEQPILKAYLKKHIMKSDYTS